MVRIQSFHCQGPGSIPGQWTEILQAMQCGQKKKRKKKTYITDLMFYWNRVEEWIVTSGQMGVQMKIGFLGWWLVFVVLLISALNKPLSMEPHWRRWWHPTPVLLPGKSHGPRSLVGCSEPMGLLRVRHDWVTSFSLSCIGEGNGNPLQCSCLKNPRDGGVWWAAIYGVAQSRTRLKRLSSSSSSHGE